MVGSTLSKLRALSCLEWRVILLSMLLLPYCAAVLRWRGFAVARARFLRRAGPASDLMPELQIALARRLSRAVDIAARCGLYRASCLRRSLVLGWFLGRQGLPFRLQLGTAVPDGDFSAHAWIECHGQPVNDAADIARRFTAFGTDGGQGR